jgi:hypothetical protein
LRLAGGWLARIGGKAWPARQARSALRIGFEDPWPHRDRFIHRRRQPKVARCHGAHRHAQCKPGLRAPRRSRGPPVTIALLVSLSRSQWSQNG